MTVAAYAVVCTAVLTVIGAWSCGGGGRDGSVVALGGIFPRGVSPCRVCCPESLDASDRRLVGRVRDHKVEYKVASF